MEFFLIFIAIVILFSLLMETISEKLGIPALLLFLVMGVLSGNSRGPLFNFAQNISIIGNICSFALIFIMFYGGFGTNIKEAKPILAKAFTLASFGVIVTVISVALFCHYILNFSLGEAFLLGSILGSTDAASVFNILRYQNLSLKNRADSLLEVESGSNDPFAYMCTLMSILYMQGELSASYGIMFLVKQIFIGVIVAIFVSRIFTSIGERRSKNDKTINQIVFIAIALLSYSLSNVLGGNGYLSAYLVGIVLGSYEFDEKPQMVSFFDGITSLMQLLLFFLLGLLISPTKLLPNLSIALSIILFMIIVARPIAITILMGKTSDKNSTALISFAGIRGAASIVFAISAIDSNIILQHDIYHIVALVVMLSLILQGSLLPFVANKLDMIQKEGNVLSTFNDYVAETSIHFISSTVSTTSPWNNLLLKAINLPEDIRVIFVKRDNETILPSGDFQIQENDELILSGRQYDTSSDDPEENITVKKVVIGSEHRWANKAIADIDIDKNKKIILINRGKDQFIPNGSITIEANDEVILSIMPIEPEPEIPTIK